LIFAVQFLFKTKTTQSLTDESIGLSQEIPSIVATPQNPRKQSSCVLLAKIIVRLTT